MSDAGPMPSPALPRRAALALLAGGAVARPARAMAVLSDAPILLIAGPEGGRLARWGAMLATALLPALPAGTRLQQTPVGGEDGVTGANQFTTRVAPDGNTLLLTPADAALAWMVGDPRARFDAAKWVGVLAATTPCVVCGRAAAPGERLRVGMAGPVGPDLAALLGLELSGFAVAPVFGVLDQDAAAQALASRAVDAVLLRGARIAANLGPLAQLGVAPLFTLGGPGGEGRDAFLPEVPTFAEFAAAQRAAPDASLHAAWRGVAGVAQTECALVLPQLTPAALVALWRRAAALAAAAPDLADPTGRTRITAGPQAHDVAHALAPDVPALTAMRGWLAERLNWKPV